MSRRRESSMDPKVFALALAVVLAAATVDRTAAAQCGATRSTCSACHDGARASYPAGAAWHTDHAFADVCAVCHGGHPEAAAQEEAHRALLPPMGGDGAQCRSCHGAASTDLAQRYAPALTARSHEDAGASGPAPAPRPPPSPPSPSSPSSSGSNDAVAGVIAVMLGALGLAWVLRREHKLAHALRRAWARVATPAWSPYLGGVLLGLVVTISMGLLGHRLSGAGAYQHLSGMVGLRLSPGSVYWTHVVPTGLTWDVAVLIGGVAGAFVSSRLAGTFRVRSMPDTGWREVFGDRRTVRWAIAFVGSMLTEIGGGIAGGCTASLAISGGAVLAPAAFLFIVGMFAGGIPTMMLVDRLTRARRRR